MTDPPVMPETPRYPVTEAGIWLLVTFGYSLGGMAALADARQDGTEDVDRAFGVMTRAVLYLMQVAFAQGLFSDLTAERLEQLLNASPRGILARPEEEIPLPANEVAQPITDIIADMWEATNRGPDAAGR